MAHVRHVEVEAHDALAPLRERFLQQHRMLDTFYNNCRGLKYLTSLIAVPVLQVAFLLRIHPLSLRIFKRERD